MIVYFHIRFFFVYYQNPELKTNFKNIIQLLKLLKDCKYISIFIYLKQLYQHLHIQSFKIRIFISNID